MMPAYATKQDMIAAYDEASLVELTDRIEPPNGVIDDVVLQAALDGASALVDSYVARRYDLPLALVPPVLKRHTKAIAFYDLHRANYPDEVRKAYEDAIEFLRGVSRGDVVLDVGGTPPPTAPAEARVEAQDRIFSQDSLKGW